MSTLLIRLAGPLQAWGIDSKFDRRNTERAPTKSGVIGMIAAALGRRRDESIDDLNALRYGVRVDREGVLLRDYHTAKSNKSAYVTNRYYLADAVFLAGLEGEEPLLEIIAAALRTPAFPLFMGRRSCPPEGKVLLGMREGKSLIQALKEEPWLVGGEARNQFVRQGESENRRVRITADEAGGESGGYFTRDTPLSFNQMHRQFGFRKVAELSVQLSDIDKEAAAFSEADTTHDAMQELEG